MSCWGTSWGSSWGASWASAGLVVPPSLVLGSLRMYPALDASGALRAATDGAPDARPALDGVPKADRWLQ